MTDYGDSIVDGSADGARGRGDRAIEVVVGKLGEGAEDENIDAEYNDPALQARMERTGHRANRSRIVPAFLAARPLVPRYCEIQNRRSAWHNAAGGVLFVFDSARLVLRHL
jgi:hypothetical protein